MRMMFVGDISLGEHYFSFGHGPRSVVECNEYIFREVDDLLNQANYVVGNLEGAVSDAGAVKSSFESQVFRGAPASIQQLKRANISIVSVANNHFVQHGNQAISDTLKMMCDEGIHAIGTQDSDILIVGEKGNAFAILGMSDVPDNTDPTQQHYMEFSLDSLKSKLARARQEADKVVLVLHWGKENLCEPSNYQKDLAKQIIELGVDVIIGHHPHIFYEIERTHHSVVAYSLGNFVFDLPWDAHLTKSGILDIVFGDTGEIETCSVWPVTLDRFGRPRLSGDPVECNGEESLSLYGWKGKMRFQQIKKFLFFLRHILRGNTKLKFNFLFSKLRAKVPF